MKAFDINGDRAKLDEYVSQIGNIFDVIVNIDDNCGKIKLDLKQKATNDFYLVICNIQKELKKNYIYRNKILK